MFDLDCINLYICMTESDKQIIYILHFLPTFKNYKHFSLGLYKKNILDIILKKRSYVAFYCNRQ